MRTAALALLALVFAAAAQAMVAPNLVGKVTVVSGGTACTKDDCGQPPAGPVTIRFASIGKAPRLVRTTGTGSFRAWLPAGTYAVSMPALRNVGVTPARIVIRKGTTRHVEFIIRVARA